MKNLIVYKSNNTDTSVEGACRLDTPCREKPSPAESGFKEDKTEIAPRSSYFE
jgi:hypothetical protein